MIAIVGFEAMIQIVNHLKQNQGIYEIFHCLTELGLQKKMPKQTQNDTIVPQNKNSKKKKKKSFCSI